MAEEVPERARRRRRARAVRALAALALGVDLDAEVLLLEGETAVALTGIGLGGTPSGQILLRPPDSDAASGLLQRVADRIGSSGGTSTTEQLEGIEVTTVSLPDTFDAAFGVVDGVVVIGLNAGDVAAVAEAHESGLTLDRTSAYEQAFERRDRPRGHRGVGRCRDAGRARQPGHRASRRRTRYPFRTRVLRPHHPIRARRDRIPRRAHGPLTREPIDGSTHT